MKLKSEVMVMLDQRCKSTCVLLTNVFEGAHSLDHEHIWCKLFEEGFDI